MTLNLIWLSIKWTLETKQYIVIITLILNNIQFYNKPKTYRYHYKPVLKGYTYIYEVF